MTTPHTKQINLVSRNCSICGNTYRASGVKMLFSFNFGNCGDCQGVKVCTLSTCPSSPPVIPSKLPIFPPQILQVLGRNFHRDFPKIQTEVETCFRHNFFQIWGRVFCRDVPMQTPLPFPIAPNSVHILPYRRILYYIYYIY